MDIQLLENITSVSCGIALFAFTIVATASRNEQLETTVQWVVSISCSLSALLLFSIAIEGGSFWGSQNMVKPLIALCIIIAIASRMNLRGEQISQGMNPHTIRLNRQEESE